MRLRLHLNRFWNPRCWKKTASGEGWEEACGEGEGEGEGEVERGEATLATFRGIEDHLCVCVCVCVEGEREVATLATVRGIEEFRIICVCERECVCV